MPGTYSHNDFGVLAEALRCAARDVDAAQLRRHRLRPAVAVQLPGAARRALIEVSEVSRLLCLPADGRTTGAEDYAEDFGGRRRPPAWPTATAMAVVVVLGVAVIPFVATLGAGAAVTVWPAALPVASFTAAGAVFAGVGWVLLTLIRAQLTEAPAWRWLENVLLGRAHRAVEAAQVARSGKTTGPEE